MFLYIALAVLAILVVMGLKFSRGARVILIKSPKLGILNFKGRSALQIEAADRSAVERFFSGTVESTSVVPSCDVLFIYCDFDADGNVVGTTLQIREIVRDSGAAVAVVASENPKKVSSKLANQPVTVKRTWSLRSTVRAGLSGFSISVCSSRWRTALQCRWPGTDSHRRFQAWSTLIAPTVFSFVREAK
jgi:hypothetical protein